MDIDLIIIILLIILTIVFFRKFSNVVYIICILDIFLRLLDIIERMLGVPEFSALVNKYFHNSIYHIIVANTSGIIETFLIWLYIAIYCAFLYYVIRTFFRKKK